VITWIGDEVVKLLRLIRDPVTTNSPTALGDSAGFVAGGLAGGGGDSVWADAPIAPAIPEVMIDANSRRLTVHTSFAPGVWERE
jgi:hypothetical protein